MSNSKEDKWQKLEKKIAEMQAEGNREGEAVLRLQKAMMQLGTRNMDAVASEIAKIGILAEKEGAPLAAAQAYMAQGKALKNNPKQHTKARQLLDKAARMYNGLNDFGHEAEALKELGNLAVGGGKYEQALKYVKRGIAAAEKADDIEKMIEFYRLGSNCYTLLGNIDKAVENLTEALVKAEEAGAADAALKVRLDREAIQGMVRREVNPEAMADILAEAERLGNLEVAGDIQMQQATVAFQEGRHEEAYELLLAARNAARDSGDLQRFNRYMMTTMMMVMVKEAMDDRPGVLSALLTCKVYLGAHLGEEVGSQINQILDGLETRWGKAGMADAVRMYQEQAKENPPQP